MEKRSEKRSPRQCGCGVRVHHSSSHAKQPAMGVDLHQPVGGLPYSRVAPPWKCIDCLLNQGVWDGFMAEGINHKSLLSENAVNAIINLDSDFHSWSRSARQKCSDDFRAKIPVFPYNGAALKLLVSCGG